MLVCVLIAMGEMMSLDAAGHWDGIDIAKASFSVVVWIPAGI